MENLELQLLIIPLVSSSFSCTLTLFLYVSILQVFIIGKKRFIYYMIHCFVFRELVGEAEADLAL